MSRELSSYGFDAARPGLVGTRTPNIRELTARKKEERGQIQTNKF
ncbi:hypothetical protein CCACVL1_07305 [Corchorus capsularis]|uniref:Uncharacterized protein n=1 Tax=Corchorus capsularis TaxID=210143 RepID=A0A1R3J7G0_COCAP|nr:hypothetical protein CCACVL1_07305 [Corchorus capsularis]